MENAQIKDSKKRIVILLALFIAVQTAVYILVGINKSYIHMDEAYSYGLASYKDVEIVKNDDFFDTWHSGEYYEEYIALTENERGDYSAVYRNQKNDVHPPLYYLLLRTAMEFSDGHFSKWPGIILNVVIYTFVTLFVYLISARLIKDDAHSKEKAAVFSLVSALTLSSMTDVVYIRMYALSTLFVLIATYLHIKLYDSFTTKVALLIGVCCFFGSLTHYFFLYYLFALFVLNTVLLLKRKRIREFFIYLGPVITAAGASLAVFPYSVKHMFFGYQGEGVISRLTDIKKYPGLFKRIWDYICKANYYVFDMTLTGLAVLVAAFLVIVLVKKKRPAFDRGFRFVFVPTLFFFLFASVTTPWIELRYILPVCPLLFASVFYLLKVLAEAAAGKKIASLLICVSLAVTLLIPPVFRAEPETVYNEKKTIMREIGEMHDVPAVYWFDTKYQRFLDDILLFSKLDASYVAKNRDCTEEEIKGILAGKDLSKGLIVLINGDQDEQAVLSVFIKATGKTCVSLLEKMNNCRVYKIE